MEVKGAKDFCNVEGLFGNRLRGSSEMPALEFHRATSDDKEVIRALLHELQVNRGLNLREKKRGESEEGKDGVALISEWDTFYGRALPEVFEQQLSPEPLEDAPRDKYLRQTSWFTIICEGSTA